MTQHFDRSIDRAPFRGAFPLFLVLCLVLPLVLPLVSCSAPKALLESGHPLTSAVERGIEKGKKTFDHSTFDRLLKAHVTSTGTVDYTALSNERAELTAYLERLKGANLADYGREELLALLMNAYNAQRVGAGTVALGLAQGAYEHALAFSKEREQFDRPIAEFQGLQWMLADMSVKLEAARSLTYRAAASRGPDGSVFPDPALAAQAKIFTSEAAIQVVSDALQVHGAAGYSRRNPLERMYRDVRMFTIGGGTAQILRTVVAGRILDMKLPQTRGGFLPKDG